MKPRCDAGARDARRGVSYGRHYPALPVVAFYTKPTPPSVLAHRAGIAAARRGEGPMYTPKKSDVARKDGGR